MADEPNAVPEGDDEVIVAPEENLEVNDQDEQPDPVANLAKEMGWRPKEEFKGDPETWKEPAEYIRAGGDIQRTQSRELREMRSTVDTIAKTSAAILADKLDRQREELTAKFNAAVDDGDSKQAFEIGQKLNGLGTQAQASGPDPLAVDWAQKNGWFQRDPVARARAIEVADLHARDGRSVSEQLEAAEAAIKREYPHHFPKQGKPPAGVNDPARAAGSAKQGNTFADLPPAARKVAQDMDDRGVCKKEAYATQYWANQRSGQ